VSPESVQALREHGYVLHPEVFSAEDCDRPSPLCPLTCLHITCAFALSSPPLPILLPASPYPFTSASGTSLGNVSPPSWLQGVILGTM
jgi:hypothetical protein